MPKERLYCLNVKLCIKPEVRAEFLECINANQRGTLSTEPLAVTYTYGEDAPVPNTFHFFEQYEGKEGFDAHTQSSHFAAWEAFASKEPFTAPPADIHRISRSHVVPKRICSNYEYQCCCMY